MLVPASAVAVLSVLALALVSPQAVGATGTCSILLTASEHMVAYGFVCGTRHAGCG